MESHVPRELDTKMPKATNALQSDQISSAQASVAKSVVGRDTRAEGRSGFCGPALIRNGSDATRFSELLAEDFVVQTPGVTRNREEFLDYIAKPRPFKDLAVHDVNIRILSDVALIHARATYTMLADGVHHEALYTDTYQKREGTWVCVAACAIAPGA